MTERPKRLNATFVKAVTGPGRFTDGRGSFGLSLHVQRSMSGRITKSWVQRIRVGGRFRYIGLGSYPVVSLAQAREAAFTNARDVRSGADPLDSRVRTARTPTFCDAAERVIELNAKSWKNGTRTAQIWRARLQAHVYLAIGSFRVNEITSAHVVGVIAPVWTTRRETGRRLRQYIATVMSWCVAQGYREDNPAAADVIGAALPKAGRTVTHQRALPWRDVANSLAKVRDSDAAETTKLAIEYLTLTVCRSVEVRGACWSEVDMGSATWTIPGSRMKQGKEHRVPLSPQALDVLQQAREFEGPSGLVFPSVTGKVMSDSTMSKLLRENGIEGTPHGMRASFKVWADEHDVDHRVSEFCLSHVVGDESVRAYARGDLFEQRRAVMEHWAEVCQAC